MMKKILKLLVCVPFFLFSLFAQVHMNAPSSFVQNEPYYFAIEANGENITFPAIAKIDHFSIQEAGQSRSISNINGAITSKYIKRYVGYPSKTFTLPSFEIQINGQKFYTPSKVVTASKRQQSNSKYFAFNLLSSKKELYVGESTVLTLQFKHKANIKIMDYRLELNAFENFWHKNLDKNRQYKEGDYIVQELDFLLFAQKEGQITIPSIGIEMVVLDNNSNNYSFFSNNTKKIKIYSNELAFNVKKLPKDISLVGEFALEAFVDKTLINAGENINYKIQVSGTGNMDDVPDFTLDIANTTLYENKPIIDTQLQDNSYKGTYTKSFSILPSQNITIPSIELSYFDLKTQEVKKLQSKAFNIQVKQNTQALKEPTLEKKESKTEKTVIVKSNNQEKGLYFMFGVLITLLSTGLYFYVINKKRKKKKDTALEKRIKQCKTKEELITQLLPYLDSNEQIKQVVFTLEKENTAPIKVYKKEILSLIKKYEIKG